VSVIKKRNFMPKKVEVFAHRGASSLAPENTLPAFEKALEMGVDGIELDVQCSKDGIPMVMHNFTVDTTTNSHGPVASFTAAELAQLDAGSHFGEGYTGVGVPALREVLDLVGSACRINVEIKSRDLTGGCEVEPLIELIRHRNLYDQVIVSSFNPVSLIKLRWLDSKVELGLLYGDPLPTYLSEAWLSPIIAPEALHPHNGLVDADLVCRAHSQSRAVNTWTVNDVERARHLQQLGVDAIISDVPGQIMAALASW
jgi:glycerophosphoryl diester phosphodiesterase